MLAKKNNYISLILVLIGLFIVTPLLASKYLMDTSIMFAISASATTTNSTCRNSGTATITATGGTAPYQYQIITKPAAYTLTTSIQNSNVFNNLAIGDYVVRVRDNSGDSTDINFTVRGTEYSTMILFLSSEENSCGGLTVRLNVALGVGDKTFYVVSGPGVTQETLLPNATFNTNVIGNYRFKVVDSCGEIVIKDYIPNATLRPFNSANVSFQAVEGSDLICENGRLKIIRRMSETTLRYNENSAGNLVNVDRDSVPYRLYVNNQLELQGIATTTDPIIRFEISNFNTNTTYTIRYEFDICGRIIHSNEIVYSNTFSTDLDTYSCPSSGLYQIGVLYNPFANYVSYYNLRHATTNNIISTNTTGDFNYYNHPEILSQQFPLTAYIEAVYTIPGGCSLTNRSTSTVVFRHPTFEYVIENCLNKYKYCDWYNYRTNSTHNFSYVFSSTNDFSNIVLTLPSATDGPTYFYNSQFPSNGTYYLKIVRTDVNGFNPVEFNVGSLNIREVTPPALNSTLNYFFGYYGGASTIIGTITAQMSIGASYNRSPTSTIKVEVISGPTTFTTFDGRNIPLNYPFELTPATPSQIHNPNNNVLTYALTLTEGTYTFRVTEEDVCFPTRITERILEVPRNYPENELHNFTEVLQLNNFNFTLTSGCGSSTVDGYITHDGYSNRNPGFNSFAAFVFAKLDENGNPTFVRKGSRRLNVHTTNNSNIVIGNIEPGNWAIYIDYGNKSGLYDFDYMYIHLAPQFKLSDMSMYKIHEFTVYPYIESSIKGITSTGCATGLRNVAVEPDLRGTTGPYTYRISSGPSGVNQQFQSSNLFTNLTVGDYTFVMKDNCGNERTLRTSIEKFIPPTFETVGNSCLNGNVTFTFPNFSYYTYQWTLPNGSTFIGNELTINNVSNANVGIYKVKFIANIDGCISELTREYYLDPCNGLIEIKKNHSRVNPDLRTRFLKY